MMAGWGGCHPVWDSFRGLGIFDMILRNILWDNDDHNRE